MGMYDDVVCEYILPDTKEINFQTKDFECFLDKYTITKEGRLLLETSDFEEVPEEERPFYNKEGWETNPVSRIFGSLKKVNIEQKDTDFHGIFNMYTMDKNDGWLEYKVKFTEGQLVSIERVEKNI